MQSEVTPPNNPPAGDKVYLPELNVWGEIVEYYDNNKQLITRVRAMVNGKPTIIDVTNLIVDLADAVKAAAGLWTKIKAAAKSLCQKLGLCKPKAAYAVVPNALQNTIATLETQIVLVEHAPDLVEKYKAQLEKLKAMLPKSKG